MRKIQLEDVFDYQFPAGLLSSPDGEKATFLTRQADLEGNTYVLQRHLFHQGVVTQLPAEAAQSVCCWADKDTLLVARTVDTASGDTQLQTIPVAGGVVQVMGQVPVPISGIYPVSQHTYFLTAWIDATQPDRYLLDATSRSQPSADSNGDVQVLDEMPYWCNGRGFTNKRRLAGFVYRADSGAFHRVTTPLFHINHVVVNQGVVYFSGEEKRALHMECHDIYAYHPDNNQMEPIHVGGEYRIHDLAWAGGRLLVSASEKKEYGFTENPWIYTPDGAGDLRWVAKPDFSYYMGICSDCRLGATATMVGQGDDLVFLGTYHNAVSLCTLSADNQMTALCTPEGSLDDLCAIGEHHLLMVAMEDNRLEEVYLFDRRDNHMEQLTHFNDAALADCMVSQPQHHEVMVEGYTVHGWAMLPPDYQPDGHYPSILHIHGGPKMAFGNVFFHEMQAWAAAGYIVIYCNPYGSDSFGDAFADLRGTYGTLDYRCIMSFVDSMIAQYPQIDPARMAVAGGSYGGFMTNWVIGHTDRFACAVSQRSIANWVTHHLLSDVGHTFSSDQAGGVNLLTGPDKLWECSPLRYAENVVTPTLFIHATEDFRCPLDDALQMYGALQLKGVPTRMCIFHGENHELSRGGRPQQRLRRLKEIFQWIESYCK